MARILITGANRGIGLALTRALVARGETIHAACRAPARATALEALETGADGRLMVHALDVNDEASVAQLAESLGDTPLDGLINNAGVIGPDRQSTLDMDFHGFALTLAVNTLSPLRVSQAVLPLLERGTAPRILTISSKMGSFGASPSSDRIAYRTSKAAVNRVMQGLAADLAPRGVAVALAHPGWVQTDMGGPNAAVTVEESAAGLIRIFDGLRVDSTCPYYDIDGSPLPW